MSRNRPVTTQDVFDEIQEYCERKESGAIGAWTQSCYKSDFFEIFRNAYANSRTGEHARSRYESERKQKPSAEITAFVVHGEDIDAYLKTHWQPYERHQEMIRDLCAWWDAWEYCLDACPEGVRRAYYRKR